MNKKAFLLLSLSLLLSVSACREDILDVKNEGQYSDATYFQNAPQFNEAVIATYAPLLGKGMYSRDWYFLFDLLGNDAERDTPLLGDLLQLHNYSFGSSHQQITDLWQTLYRIVFRANLILDKAEQWTPQGPSRETDNKLKAQYIAEARFLKGFAQMYLVTLWGRVPLRPDLASSNNFFAPRTAEADVWRAVVADLNAAAATLPVTYGASDRGRATQGAAIALLGKALLYQGKYADAATQFEKLTKAPFSYSLNPNFDAQFSEANANSPETIFDIQHRWGGWGEGNAFYMFGGQEAWGNKATHTGRGMEYGWNDWRNVVVSDATVKAFKYKDEAGKDYFDPRAKLTFYGDAASGGDVSFCHGCSETPKDTKRGYSAQKNAGGQVFYNYPYNASNGYRWRKYNNYEAREFEEIPQSNINSQVIRYADVLLMLAECYINTNKISDALPLINQVRKRVGAFEYTALGSQPQAMEKLMRERRLELAGEQSRYFDLIRWGVAQQTINAEKQAQIGAQPFQARNVLLPIPQLEKDTNPEVAKDIKNEWN